MLKTDCSFRGAVIQLEVAYLCKKKIDTAEVLGRALGEFIANFQFITSQSSQNDLLKDKKFYNEKIKELKNVLRFLKKIKVKIKASFFNNIIRGAKDGAQTEEIKEFIIIVEKLFQKIKN